MSPTLLLSIISAAVTEAPALISTLKEVFSASEVTPATIEAKRAAIAAETFGELAPASAAALTQAGQ